MMAVAVRCYGRHGNARGDGAQIFVAGVDGRIFTACRSGGTEFPAFVETLPATSQK